MSEASRKIHPLVSRPPDLLIGQSKATSRVLTGHPTPYEMVGVDGRVEEGVRPFPGFRTIHEFSFADVESDQHDVTSRVLDVFPFQAFVGQGNERMYGFVYRVRRKSSSPNCDIFLDYWNSRDEQWSLANLINISGARAVVPTPDSAQGPSGGSVDQIDDDDVLTVPVSRDVDPVNGRHMSVTVVGRLLYVFVEGRKPILVYLKSSAGGVQAVLRPTIHSTQASTPVLTSSPGLYNLRETGKVELNGDNTSYETNDFLRNTLGGDALTVGTDTNTTTTTLPRKWAGRAFSGRSFTWSILMRPFTTATDQVILSANSADISNDGLNDPLMGASVSLNSSNTKVSFRRGGSGAVEVDYSTATWNVWSFTYDGVGTLRVYKDGVLAGSGSAAVTTDNSDDQLSFTFGSAHGGANPCQDVRVVQIVLHNRELSAEEVADLHSDFVGKMDGRGDVEAFELFAQPNTGPGERPLLDAIDDSVYAGLNLPGPPGRDAIGHVKLTSLTPGEWSPGLTTQASDDVHLFESGDYTVAYALADSVTGRRTPLSEVVMVKRYNFRRDDISVSVLNETDLRSAYMLLEVRYDSTKYDRLLVYRSLRTQTSTGSPAIGQLALDKVVDLTDEGVHPDFDDGVGGYSTYRYAVHFFEAPDGQLALSEPWLDDSIFDKDMPRGGSSVWYEGTMLVSSINLPSRAYPGEGGTRTRDPGLGETRWSSLYTFGPEMFSPVSRYVPSTAGDSVMRFVEAGENLFGFSSTQMYFFRKQTGNLIALPLHQGFGITMPRNAESVGSVIYFVNQQGVFTVNAQGALDQVNNLNRLITREWQGSLEKVSCAYDPQMGCLFIFNRTHEEAAVLWFMTGKVTQLADLTFQHVTSGQWPSDFTFDADDLSANNGANNTGYSNSLERIAMFVQNPVGSSSTAVARILTVDRDREETQSGGRNDGSSTTRLMPGTAETLFSVGSDFSAGNTITLDKLDVSDVLTDSWNNTYLYVLDAADESLIGAKAKVVSCDGATPSVTLTSGSNLHGLVEGDVLGFSPVFVEIGWGVMAPSNEDGMVYGSLSDLFRLRQINALAAVFEDVQGIHTGTYARYRGAYYTGDDPTADGYAYVRDTDGALAESITESRRAGHAAFGVVSADGMQGRYGVQGTNICPAIQTFVPDVDYRMMVVVVEGEFSTVEGAPSLE